MSRRNYEADSTRKHGPKSQLAPESFDRPSASGTGELSKEGQNSLTTPTDPGPSSPTSNLPSSDSAAIEAVRDLDRVIERFREGNISKTRAIATITTKLNFDLAKDEPSKFAALNHYLRSIESYERLSLEASKRGTHAVSGTGAPLAEPTHPESIQPIQRGDVEASNEEEVTFFEPFTSQKDATRRKHQRHSVASSSSSEDSHGSEDDQGPTSKRKKIYEKDMPWYQQEIAARQTGNTSSDESRRILLLIGDNVPAVKHWVSVAKTAPRGFPMSEWENIARGKASISTSYSVPFTIYHQSKRMLDAWDRLKSALVVPSQHDEFELVVNGPQHGTRPSKPPPSSSLIARLSFANTGITSTGSSPPKLLKPTVKSFSMIQQSEPKLGEGKMSYSLIGNNSNTFILPSSCQTESRLGLDKELLQTDRNQISADVSTL